LSASNPEVGAQAKESEPPAKVSLGLTDTHCHLNLAAFGRDLEQVLLRARRSGVVRMMVPGVDLASSQAAVELAARVQEVFAAVGIHPHSASEFNSAALTRLRELARSRKVAAVGEIGLDYSRDLPGPEVQRRSFQEQLGLAAALDLPIIVHMRDSVEETLLVLEEWAESRHATSVRGVFHAYGGSQEAADFAEQWGVFVGIGGIFTYPKADGLRDRIRRGWPQGGSSLEKVLLETDAPYLPPQGHRGERNEPALVARVADQIGQELGLPTDGIAEITRRNAQRLFNWE
jgi:TatD DNase family protein